MNQPSSRPETPIEALPRKRLWDLVLARRDAIERAYHVLTFEAPEPIAASPGQFAMIRAESWGNDPLLPRPMSLLTAGERPSILIKVVGKGTGRMALAAPGERFSLLAPLGKPWSSCPPDHRAVLVAGGVGVAPLVYFAQRLSASSAERPLALYGGRTRADLPLSEELGAASELRVTTEDGSRGESGRVTKILERALDELEAAGRRVKVYTCGPSGMMAAVARICEGRGALCEVSVETPMACGYGVCLGCPVPLRAGGFLYACSEGPCIDASAIDWQKAGRIGP